MASQVALGKWWASRGYAYVVQDVRGRGESDGEFYPLVTEAVDGDDTITWCGTAAVVEWQGRHDRVRRTWVGPRSTRPASATPTSLRSSRS